MILIHNDWDYCTGGSNTISPWGPLPRNTSLVITRSSDRILTAFDDVVQFGLVKLRTEEIRATMIAF